MESAAISTPAMSESIWVDETMVMQAMRARAPSVMLQLANEKQAKSQLAQATPWANPQISTSYEQVGRDSWLERETETSMSIPVFQPTRRPQIDGAESQLHIAQAQTRRVASQAILSGLVLYYELLETENQLEVRQRWRARFQEVLRIVQRRVEAGQSAGYEQLRMELALGIVDSDIRLLHGEIGALRARLANYLDVDPGFRYKEKLRPTRLQSVVEEWTRPSWETLALAKDRAARGTKRSQHAWMPTLSVQGGLRTRADDVRRAWGFVAGISANIPWGRPVKAVRERAEANEQSAHAQLQALQFTDRQAAIVAQQRYIYQMQELVRFEHESQAIVEALTRAVEVGYQEGERGVLELVDAFSSAQQVELRILHLSGLARRRELELREALGEFE